MAEVDIPLKLKYRTKWLGEKNGTYKTRTGNSHGDKKRVVIRPHPRRYTNSGLLVREDRTKNGPAL